MSILKYISHHINYILAFFFFIFSAIEPGFKTKLPISSFILFFILLNVIISIPNYKEKCYNFLKKYYKIIIVLFVLNSLSVLTFSLNEGAYTQIKDLFITNIHLSIFTFLLLCVFFINNEKKAKIVLKYFSLSIIPFFLISGVYDLIRLTTNISFYQRDPDHYYGISYEPWLQAELILIYIILLTIFKKEILKIYSPIIILFTFIPILFGYSIDQLTISIFLFIIIFIPFYYLKNSLVFLLLFGFLTYWLILLFLDQETLYYILNNYNFEHTLSLGIQNHFFSVKQFWQCGLLGCGFGVMPIPIFIDTDFIHIPAVTLYEEINNYKSYPIKKTIYMKDAGSIFFRLIRDVGMIGLFFTLMWFYTLGKLIKCNNNFTVHALVCLLIILSSAWFFHYGVYTSGKLYLIVIVFLFINNVSVRKNV